MHTASREKVLSSSHESADIPPHGHIQWPPFNSPALHTRLDTASTFGAQVGLLLLLMPPRCAWCCLGECKLSRTLLITEQWKWLSSVHRNAVFTKLWVGAFSNISGMPTAETLIVCKPLQLVTWDWEYCLCNNWRRPAKLTFHLTWAVPVDS